jgi:hypothetical protein
MRRSKGARTNLIRLVDKTQSVDKSLELIIILRTHGRRINIFPIGASIEQKIIDSACQAARV